MIECLHCGKARRRSMIISKRPSDRWFNICAPCVAEIEAEELRQDIERNKKLKERNAKVTQKVQKAVARAETTEQVRDAVKKTVTAHDLRIKAREELALRELCRRSLIDYIRRFKGDYKAGWIHQVICRRLEQFLDDVVNRRSPRLMIAMPPRHGKSEITSDKFPSWALGRHPDLEIILASYAAALAVGFSKVNRERLRDPVYQQIFPQTKLDNDEQGAEFWRTTRRGGFLAAGVGGPVTGRGADIFIIDDPVKNYEEAESELIRENVKNWWRSTARTRLSPGGGVLLIMTRWHDDDLAGFLQREYVEGMKEGIPEEELENFELLNFPAIAEENEFVDNDWLVYHDHDKPNPCVQVRQPGDPLHPARYSAEYLNKTKRSMGDRMFGALYQQNPVPDSGDFFRVEDFRYYHSVPNLGVRPVYFALDPAVSVRQSGDFSFGVAAMYNERGEVYVLDAIRGRWRANELIDRMIGLISRFPHNMCKLGVEQGLIWEAIREEFVRRMRQRGLYITIDETLRPMVDKRLRARPLQAWLQSGRIKFPSGQPWMEQVRSELLRFDAGVHDDAVDALAWLVRMLQNEPPPDVELLRRAKDKWYVGTKEKQIADYLRAQQSDGGTDKRFMGS